jgi:3-oxoacyl-[acyl-carrier-protein] synthase II
VEAVATVMALQTGWLHPNPNLVNPDPAVDLAKVVGRVKQQHAVDVALSNSFGFGGHNSCILFAKYSP